jgi:DNA adenine methylase
MFLHSNFNESILSDINPHLINTYKQIKNSPLELIDQLLFHKNQVSETYYYEVRNIFNERKDCFTIDQAAIFIFLVHTSFNGIYRVNKKGLYNVPFGKLKHSIPNANHILLISEKLKSATIFNSMYEDILPNIEMDDFVYFDPPYPPLNSTSFFQHYSIDKFPDSQQKNLAFECMKISDRGGLFMVSNADTPEIREYYKGCKFHVVETFRFVNCKSERKKVNELIITNY